MFYQNGSEQDLTQKAFDEATTEARGAQPLLAEKIRWLQERWESKRYKRIGEEASLMHTLLFKRIQPIHTAVVADNLAFFKKNYIHTTDAAKSFLLQACLCGSRTIAEYLLEKLQSSYKKQPDLLAYIAASMNTQWTEDVASILAKEKCSIPKDIYRLADANTIDTITDNFKAFK